MKKYAILFSSRTGNTRILADAIRAALPDAAPNLDQLIDNFDRALSHPDAADLKNLRQAILK